MNTTQGPQYGRSPAAIEAPRLGSASTANRPMAVFPTKRATSSGLFAPVRSTCELPDGVLMGQLRPVRIPRERRRIGTVGEDDTVPLGLELQHLAARQLQRHGAFAEDLGRIDRFLIGAIN